MELKPLVLVIEDDPVITRLIREILTNSGYAVVSAASALESARAVRARKPDLILADVLLPGGPDGATTAALLKTSLDLEYIPVILVSALSREDLEALRAEGGCDYVQKPFHAVDLIERVKEGLARSRREEEFG